MMACLMVSNACSISGVHVNLVLVLSPSFSIFAGSEYLRMKFENWLKIPITERSSEVVVG